MILDKKRIDTMRRRLKKASELIREDSYLPMFRNRQINYPEEFAFSVELAKSKQKPSRYFSSLWGTNKIKNTLVIIRRLISLAKSKIANLRHEKSQREYDEKCRREVNEEGLARLRAMKENIFKTKSLRI